MDLLGNIANLKVDTVLSAVDKYVPGEYLVEVSAGEICAMKPLTDHDEGRVHPNLLLAVYKPHVDIRSTPAVQNH